MKKSELKKMIREELLGEAKQKWPIKDKYNTVFKTSKLDTSHFEIAQTNDGKINLLLVDVEDINLFISALQNIQRKLG